MPNIAYIKLRNSDQAKYCSVFTHLGFPIPSMYKCIGAPQRGNCRRMLQDAKKCDIKVNSRQGREADHSPPTNAKVKKMLIYKSTPPYTFMA
jgi:hypothetical protein